MLLSSVILYIIFCILRSSNYVLFIFIPLASSRVPLVTLVTLQVHVTRHFGIHLLTEILQLELAWRLKDCGHLKSDQFCSTSFDLWPNRFASLRLESSGVWRSNTHFLAYYWASLARAPAFESNILVLLRTYYVTSQKLLNICVSILPFLKWR